MTERNIEITVELLKQGLTPTQVIRVFKSAGITLTKEDKKEIKSIARGNGLE